MPLKVQYGSYSAYASRILLVIVWPGVGCPDNLPFGVQRFLTIPIDPSAYVGFPTSLHDVCCLDPVSSQRRHSRDYTYPGRIPHLHLHQTTT